MSIPEGQLEVWTGPGASATAKTTHESIRTALARHLEVPGAHEVYLQGSYKNDTNIRGDSDVDVVVQYNGAWHRDLSALPATEQALYDSTYSTAEYRCSTFRADVAAALREYYGTSAIDDTHPKALKLTAASGRLAADIVPAFHFREYTHFRGSHPSQHGYYDGIQFLHAMTGAAIINYPKRHYDNGVSKNRSTGGRFKPVVRMFKNARTYLVAHGQLAKHIAPSYFVENLLHNVPDAAFGGSLQDAFKNIHRHLGATEEVAFLSQHGRHALFGEGSNQWRHDHAVELLDAVATLWNDWYD